MLAFVKSMLQKQYLKCCTSITMLAAHKCVHHRGYHTFWMVSVATSTLSPDLTPSPGHVKNSLKEHYDTIDKPLQNAVHQCLQR